MIDIISILLITAAFGVLALLATVDLKTKLLPNTLVLSLAVACFAFHAATLFYYADAQDLALGAFIGGGTLYFIRLLANFYYKDDTLGLGDVKLLAAGGILLGSYDILIALIAGALAGLLHGLIVIAHKWGTTKEIGSISRLSIPAGPGFAVGITIAALAKFWPLPHLSF